MLSLSPGFIHSFIQSPFVMLLQSSESGPWCTSALCPGKISLSDTGKLPEHQWKQRRWPILITTESDIVSISAVRILTSSERLATFPTTWSIHCVAYCQYILSSVLHLKTNSQLSELARDKVHSCNTRGSNNLISCSVSWVKWKTATQSWLTRCTTTSIGMS